VFEAGRDGLWLRDLSRPCRIACHLRHFFVEARFAAAGFAAGAFERLREMFPRGKRILVEVLVWNAPGRRVLEERRLRGRLSRPSNVGRAEALSPAISSRNHCHKQRK
jgi:hypothetical protein